MCCYSLLSYDVKLKLFYYSNKLDFRLLTEASGLLIDLNDGLLIYYLPISVK